MRISTGESTPPFFLWLTTTCLLVGLSPAIPPLQAQGLPAATSEEFPAELYQTVLLPVEHSTLSTPAVPANFSELLRALLLDSMKEEYVDQRDWRGTVHRFDGFRRQGARISKREKEVPHGIWRRYKATLIRPEKHFDVKVAQLPPNDSDALRFSILITLRARVESTFVWWTYGVKGVNGTMVSDATLQLHLVLRSNPRFTFTLDAPLPRLELRPEIARLELKLKDLDVRKFGVLKGDLAEMLGDGARKAIETLIRQQEPKIKKKLQENLEAAQ